MGRELVLQFSLPQSKCQFFVKLSFPCKKTCLLICRIMLRHACQLIYGSLFLTPELGMRQLFSLTTTPHFNRASGTKNYWKNVTVSVSKWSIYIVLRIRMWNVYSDTHEGFRQKYATVSGIPQNFSCRLKQKDKILLRMGVTSASHLSSTSTSSSW